MIFESRLNSALAQRREKGLDRCHYSFDRSIGPDNQIQQINAQHASSFVNFSSNDYLGLATDKSLINAWYQGLALYGSGSSASPAVTGQSSAHSNLQSKLCEWLGYYRAVLFNSGFSANQALLFTLLKKRDHLIQDKLNHASLIEAGVLCPATMHRFKHNDVTDLSKKLEQLPEQQAKLVVTEGVFSMDGDIASLQEIARESEKTNAWLMLDDAHGLGVLGATGAGTCELYGVRPNILVVTFGKAVGVSGAAILCDESTGEFLTQFARHYVYSTAMPPAQAYAINHAISMIQQQQWRRDKLSELSETYHHQLSSFPNNVETQTAIKPWICGTSQQALSASQSLKDNGFWVSAIRPPTVPANSARLRITLNANHTVEQVTRLTNVLAQHYPY